MGKKLQIGYVGEGPYSLKSHLPQYKKWYSMLHRVHINRRSYMYSSVLPEWHCFQNFCKDTLNMCNSYRKGFVLDKDLRKLGNMNYGPDYCSFVPLRINSLLASMPVFTEDSETKVLKVHTMANEYREVIHVEVYDTLMNIRPVYFDKLREITSLVLNIGQYAKDAL